MEIAFIYLQILGILFGYEVSKQFPEMTKIQFLKVLFLSVVPTIIYINLKLQGIP